MEENNIIKKNNIGKDFLNSQREEKINNFCNLNQNEKTLEKFLELNILCNFYSEEGRKYIGSCFSKKYEGNILSTVIKYHYNLRGFLGQVCLNQRGFYNDILLLYNNNSEFKDIIDHIINYSSSIKTNDNIYEFLNFNIVKLKSCELLNLLESIFEITPYIMDKYSTSYKNKLKAILEKHKNNTLIQLQLFSILKKGYNDSNRWLLNQKNPLFLISETLWELHINKYMEITKNNIDIDYFTNECIFNSKEITKETKEVSEGNYYYQYSSNITPICLLIIKLQDEKIYENILQLLIDNCNKEIFKNLCQCITEQYSGKITNNILDDTKKIQQIYNNLNKIIDNSNNIEILKNSSSDLKKYYHHFYNYNNKNSNILSEKVFMDAHSILMHYQNILPDRSNIYTEKIIYNTLISIETYNDTINNAKILEKYCDCIIAKHKDDDEIYNIKEDSIYKIEGSYVEYAKKIKNQLTKITNLESKYI